MVFIYISFMANDVEHFSVFFLMIYTSSFENAVFREFKMADS
jgi:hypothetical protein